jgi:membrane fusion protein (multidrug efflux system)
MSKRKRLYLIISIIILIAIMALFPVIRRSMSSGVDSGKKTGNPSASASAGRGALHVNASILGYHNIEEMFPTVGILLPDEEVDLSFETSGKVTDIFFKEGSNVRKGSLLAKVNDKPLQAELKKLEAQLPLAQDRLFRQQSLLEKDAVSQESYESVATELETLKADIDLVKARIAQTELRAPFDGIIGLRNVSEGTYASPTTVVSRLTKTMPLKVEFAVNEKQAAELAPGKTISFTVSGDNQNEYKATVYAIESMVDRATFSLKARALYPNPGGKLMPGHSANVTLELSDYQNSIVVPAITLIAEMGRDIVYLYKDGIARQTVIQKGLRTASSVQITEGLIPGDTLITSGVMQLRDGMAVEIDNLSADQSL